MTENSNTPDSGSTPDVDSPLPAADTVPAADVAMTWRQRYEAERKKSTVLGAVAAAASVIAVVTSGGLIWMAGTQHDDGGHRPGVSKCGQHYPGGDRVRCGPGYGTPDVPMPMPMPMPGAPMDGQWDAPQSDGGVSPQTPQTLPEFIPHDDLGDDVQPSVPDEQFGDEMRGGEMRGGDGMPGMPGMPGTGGDQPTSN